MGSEDVYKRQVLADTVGFISQLPTELVEAFKSTLEEVVQADLLLHVHDSASPLVAEEAGDVHDVLGDLGLDEEAQDQLLLSVLNKSDLLDDDNDQSDVLDNLVPGAARVSALTGNGIDDLLAEDHRSRFLSAPIPARHPAQGCLLYTSPSPRDS